MIRERHPRVAEMLVAEFSGEPATPFLQAASLCGVQLIGRMEFDPPSWDALARGARPPTREPEDREPGTTRHGWQQEASSRVEGEFRNDMFSRIPDQTQALIRSQSGRGAGAALTVTPSNRETSIPSHLFRVILLRRLRLALPLYVRVADVAVHLILVATIVQLAPQRGCSVEGGLHLRASWRAFAEKQETACARTSW